MGRQLGVGLPEFGQGEKMTAISSLQNTPIQTQLPATKTTTNLQHPFGQVLKQVGNAMESGAGMIASTLPGGPMLVAALSSAENQPNHSLGIQGNTLSQPLNLGGNSSVALSDQGLGTSTLGTSALTMASDPSLSASSAAVGSSVESTNSAEYFLQLQQQISAESRSYTAFSNVMKSRHDSVKSAINNLR